MVLAFATSGAGELRQRARGWDQVAGLDGPNRAVYSRERAHARPLEQRGAKIAATPRRSVEAADVVLSSVADDSAVANVVHGNDGALAAARSGATFIEMSTISPELARGLYENVRGR